MKMMNKKERHALIKKVITQNEIKTQEQLVEELAKNGLEITQATISRDIRELNLAKYPAKSGGTRYGFVSDYKYLDTIKLRKKLEDALVSIERVEYFVILKTLPGHAQTIGAVLDELDWEEKAGTICGNDTSLIICKTKEQAKVVENRLKTLSN
jgi:transcriptional regulator of arginine metabolism